MSFVNFLFISITLLSISDRIVSCLITELSIFIKTIIKLQLHDLWHSLWNYSAFRRNKYHFTLSLSFQGDLIQLSCLSFVRKFIVCVLIDYFIGI